MVADETFVKGDVSLTFTWPQPFFSSAVMITPPIRMCGSEMGGKYQEEESIKKF